MSKHSLGSKSLMSGVHLKVAGYCMFFTARVAAKAEGVYLRAYIKRHGIPSLHEILNRNMK